MTIKRDAELLLEVSVPEQDAFLGNPYPVKVGLTNQSAGRLRLNKRMAPGYRGHLSRELFAELKEAGADRPVKVHEIDYDRDFAGPDDFVYIEPGACLYAEFDLLEWYTPVSPGAYDLVIYYQADEELASPPADTFQGIAQSEPVRITIRPGRSDMGQGDQG